jgi:DNA-binding IclR family transcriptional regulator
MDRQQKESSANIVLTMLRSNPQINVKDVATKLRINRDKARRLLDWMVSQGYIIKQTIKFDYNVMMNVYSRNV